ncbi:MAG: AAA family ATPase [Halobacteriovoraceae bacterium]|nr:AAA family ATPase [Halobacteriovoraceae bacterium]
MEELSGIVQRITFHNEQNGWTVLKVSPFKDPRNVVAVTIHQAKVYAGATMDFFGSWSEHPKFGRQFKAEKAFEKKPATAAALEKYLGSGLIFGVGPKTAKKIVQTFGDETLEVFENEIDRLTEVEGIAKNKLTQIKKAWIEHREIRNVMLFLQSHGVSTLFAVKIFKLYGEDSIRVVKEDPYRLSRDIYGVGFMSADKIALNVGLSLDSPQRIKAAISHVLALSKEEGHCYLTQEQIGLEVKKLLNQELNELVIDCLSEMKENSEVCTREFEGEVYFYSKKLFFDELYTGKRIAQWMDLAVPIDDNKINIWLEKYNSLQEFPLSDEQKRSVASIVSQKFSILTGGPGCGKTTTTKTLVKLLLAMKKRVTLAAPTGRAAQRMGEVIGLEAKTIHRLLVWNPATGMFKTNEESPLDTDFVILDECSMLDISLTASVLRAIPATAQVLFIGDSDQLASVGAGNVLKDLIESKKVKCFKLTQIFRQGKESHIIQYAHQINRGEFPDFQTPFKDASLWKQKVDCMFIDSEEATQEDMRFIYKIKSLKNSDKDLFVSEKEFMEEEQNLVKNLDIGKLNYSSPEVKRLDIPPKYYHVNIDSLLATQSKIDEVKQVLKKVHPYSSLHFGMLPTDMILKLYIESIKKYYPQINEIQVLCPMTKGSLGTQNLNSLLQEHFNREQTEMVIGGRKFKIGDRVIQKKNNYDLEVFNGDIGVITNMDPMELSMVVEYTGAGKIQEVFYKREDLNEIDLAYAITIHKSQGSEFDAVIIPVTTQHFKMLTRNLIYTALTRAKKLAIFVGTKRAMAMAIRNIDNKKRQTFLKEILTIPEI